jgi:Sulfotransferase family
MRCPNSLAADEPFLFRHPAVGPRQTRRTQQAAAHCKAPSPREAIPNWASGSKPLFMLRRKPAARIGGSGKSYAVAAVQQHYPDFEPDYIEARLRGSTYVSLRHRYLYFEVPKAACTSLKYLVFRLENCPPAPEYESFGDFVLQADSVTRRDDIIHIRERFPVPSLVDLDSDTQREVLESSEFLRFAVVRNPYSRLVSAWRSKVLVCDPGFEDVYKALRGGLPAIGKKLLISFREFVEFIERFEDLDLCNPHWRRQSGHLFLPAINFNLIGKTERLIEILHGLQQHVAADSPLEMRSSNTSGSSKDPMFTPELGDRIYSLYRRDFDAFGYERTSWPQERSGGTISEDIFHDEIIERNLVISSLYAEIKRLHYRPNVVRRLRRALAGFLPRHRGHEGRL